MNGVLSGRVERPQTATKLQASQRSPSICQSDEDESDDADATRWSHFNAVCLDSGRHKVGAHFAL